MGFKWCSPARAIFMALSLGGMILLGGCGNLGRQSLGPDRTTVAQKGSEKASVNPKVAKAAARTDTLSTSSQTSGKLKGAAPSSYSLGDDILPPEGGNP